MRTDGRCCYCPLPPRRPHRFDPEGFSVWRVDFKYPEELTQVFMSSNQIGGFFSASRLSPGYRSIAYGYAQTDWKGRESTCLVLWVSLDRRIIA